MPSLLNIPSIQNAMKNNGLSGRKLAEQLNVSPQTIANWLSSESFPHPSQLLKLALRLRIEFDELIIQATPDADEPRVAARARLNRVLSDATLAELKGMGKLLEQMVDYLPFDTLESPPRLTNPVTEASYLQQVSQKVRSDIGVNAFEPVKFEDLVERFAKHKAVLIPVLWGKKEGHENAIHILLPKTGTTWVYLNLDTYLPDFKFWMAHELGHVYSPSLNGTDAEKFADAFAGALLFPHTVASMAYEELSTKRSPTSKVKVLDDYAARYGISSYSVFKEANGYAGTKKLDLIKIPQALLHGGRNVTNQMNGTIAEVLWHGKLPQPKEYIKVSTKIFKTPFFDVLGKYIQEKNKSSNFVHAVLDVPLLDAKALHLELA